LLDVIIEHIPPAERFEGTTQMQITSLDYSSYVGRIAVGNLPVAPGYKINRYRW
jgi:GTP-binding protein